MDELSRRLAQGDAAAFAELYDLCAERLHKYLVLRLGSRDDAADVLQETFVRLVRSRRQLHSDRLVAYVFAAARNEAARFQGRRSREPRQSSEFDQQAWRGVDPWLSMAGAESAQAVQEALASLNSEQREVVALKIYGELTFREIAEVTGLPQGTLATRYRAAIERLRGLLAKEQL